MSRIGMSPQRVPKSTYSKKSSLQNAFLTTEHLVKRKHPANPPAPATSPLKRRIPLGTVPHLREDPQEKAPLKEQTRSGPGD